MNLLIRLSPLLLICEEKAMQGLDSLKAKIAFVQTSCKRYISQRGTGMEQSAAKPHSVSEGGGVECEVLAELVSRSTSSSYCKKKIIFRHY